MPFNYSNLSNSSKKYWQECLCDDTLCAIGEDSLLFMFEIEDISHLLAKYPRRGNKYYFNYTLDREIGEIQQSMYLYPIIIEYLVVNPQFVYQNFKEVLT